MELEELENHIRDLKFELEHQYGREITWEDATQAYRTLEAHASVSLDVAKEEIRRQKLLTESPNGFHYDRPHCMCGICGEAAYAENSWYDKYGLKCITCQDAINQKIIPGAVTKDRSSWYSNNELERYFNISNKELKKYIKSGVLRDRVILTTAKKLHLQLFLLKDNKNVLPPKKLVKPEIVMTKRNGEDYFTDASWYEVMDIKSFEKLKRYKIVECFPETFSKPIIQSGHFYWKFISPILIPGQ
jgi:hypothetical protein